MVHWACWVLSLPRVAPSGVRFCLCKAYNLSRLILSILPFPTSRVYQFRALEVRLSPVMLCKGSWQQWQLKCLPWWDESTVWLHLLFSALLCGTCPLPDSCFIVGDAGFCWFVCVLLFFFNLLCFIPLSSSDVLCSIDGLLIHTVCIINFRNLKSSWDQLSKKNKPNPYVLTLVATNPTLHNVYELLSCTFKFVFSNSTNPMLPTKHLDFPFIPTICPPHLLIHT